MSLLNGKKLAVIGDPIAHSLSPVIQQAMLDALGPKAMSAIRQKGEKYYVDNKFCNALWLQRAGVGALDISPDCTACNLDRYWSHRKQGDMRGSLAGIIMLK